MKKIYKYLITACFIILFFLFLGQRDVNAHTTFYNQTAYESGSQGSADLSISLYATPTYSGCGISYIRYIGYVTLSNSDDTYAAPNGTVNLHEGFDILCGWWNYNNNPSMWYVGALPGGGSPPPPPPPPTPTVSYFYSSPNSITSGGYSYLWYGASNMTYGYICGNGVGGYSAYSCSYISGNGSYNSGSVYIVPPSTGYNYYYFYAYNSQGNASASTYVYVSPPPPPSVNYFYPSPSPVNSGNYSYLYYSANNMTSGQICGLGIYGRSGWTCTPVSPSSGSIYVYPPNYGINNYYFYAYGPGGSTSGGTSINVIPRPITLNFSASRTYVYPGEQASLYWSSNNATGGVYASFPPSTYGYVSPQNSYGWPVTPNATVGARTTYYLTGYGENGTSLQKSIPIDTIDWPWPTVNLSASPSVIMINYPNTENSKNVTFSWWSNWAYNVSTTFGANGYLNYNNWPVTINTSVPRTETYYATAYGKRSGSTASASASVQVRYNAPVVNFSATPPRVPYNGSSNLVFSATNSQSCTITSGTDTPMTWNGVGAINNGAGTSTGNLTADKTYTLSCTGPGSATPIVRTVTISIVPLPTLTFTANPTTVAYATQQSTLTWNMTSPPISGEAGYPTPCVATNGYGAVWTGNKGPTSPAGGQSTGNLPDTKTYTLTCTNISGSVSKDVTVNVTLPPAPTVNLYPGTTENTQSSVSINYNTAVTGGIRWIGRNLESPTFNPTPCTASGDYSGWVGRTGPGSGSYSTGNLTKSGVYTLTCTGPGGPPAVDSVTVNLIPWVNNGAVTQDPALYCSTGVNAILSWTFNGEGGQSAYQVQVNTSNVWTAPLYDSGKVPSTANSVSLTKAKIPTFNYNTLYYWRLKVWDAQGKESAWSGALNFRTLLNAFPVINFDWVPAGNPLINTSVVFTDKSTASPYSIISRLWTFPDGTPATISNVIKPSVKFTKIGTKGVTLKDTSNAGATYSCSKTLNINIGGSFKPPQYHEVAP